MSPDQIKDLANSIISAAAPQPPVEGLVPVYVKKWRTLIMVPPSIRDEINADIAALASPSLTAREPAAWQRKHHQHGWVDCRREDVEHYRTHGQEVRPLYAAPATLIEQSEKK